VKKLLVIYFILLSTLLSAYSIDFDNNTSGFVRHLKIYKHPAWIAQINLSNGKKVPFCSPKSMFEFYLHPGRWPDMHLKSESDFQLILVTDYISHKIINAKEAFFVYGSNITSPAGDDLPAFSSYEEADKFMKKYGGARVMSFKEISYGLIKLLNGDI